MTSWLLLLLSLVAAAALALGIDIFPRAGGGIGRDRLIYRLRRRVPIVAMPVARAVLRDCGRRRRRSRAVQSSRVAIVVRRLIPLVEVDLLERGRHSGMLARASERPAQA